ncbi:flagellar basal body rod protein FlgB [Planococcus salinarum]|uniref:flagellar basal body rod protein FlgB n=1 Tax=Planococcus salinarum TaxID=622695 RepID=UPI000E3DE3BA|nr:flagellar basal body rod protein FlgB [Planococcus salinarum]TAA72220.1 flagellar basal body rod protein FlgB [Planococcus salinarum]
MNLISPTIQSLEQALSTSALKQQTHTANIANVDTPGYKAKQVDFATVLKNAAGKQAMASYKTDAKHISFSNESAQYDPRVTVNENSMYKINGNNVDMDVEMAELAKNQLHYNAVTDRISGKFRSLSSVISGGR